MSGSKALVLFSFLACCSAYNIDVKTDNHVIKQGQGGSLFGYSLSLHTGNGFKREPTIFVGAPLGTAGFGNVDYGNLMECVINEKTCGEVLIDKQTAESHQFRSKQWLGATVYSNGDGKVVVCAPRYSEIDEAKYHMIGKCIVAHQVIERIRLYPCTREEAGHDLSTRSENGFCQAGFSATLLRKPIETVVMGAVMGKDQLGTVFQQKNAASLKFSQASSDQSSNGFYLGYAVTSGRFYQKSVDAIAASIPRIDIFGKVNIYSSKELTYIATVTPPARVRQEYIYFGASVCAVDVNDDGYDDLIVGAPFYSDKGDEGRVYIYLSSEIASSQDRRVLRLSSDEDTKVDPGLHGSNTKGARFGWSLAKAGDLNNDEIQDFIVGAPQDQPDLDDDGFGNGAIYIYHGRKDGKFNTYQQKITADTVKAFFPNFQQFGYAVTGNVDTNNDEYPDIAIGAWQSDRVLLLRTRPVMDLKATMTLSKNEIPVDNFTADCTNTPNTQCLDVKVCFSYIGKNVSGRHEIKYTFELDAETTSRLFKRVFLLVGGTKVYETTANFNLTGKNDTACVDFVQIHVEDKNRLTDALSRGTTDIVFSLKYELISPPECETTALCPVLDQSKKLSVSEKATLVLNCSDNTCDYNLKVKITPDKKEITIGKTKVLTAVIELSNHDEISYNPEVVITHDSSLQYEKITVLDKQFRIERRSPAVNATVLEIFRIQGPLDTNQKVSFRLQYSTDKVTGTKSVLKINVKAMATAGREKDVRDNNATAYVFVRRDVAMAITGTSVPKLLNYPANAPVLNIQNNNDFSAVNVSAVGPLVKVTFELANTGGSDLQPIQLSISYPLTKFQREAPEYIVYPIRIEKRGNGLCNKTGVNPANLSLPTNNEKSQRRRRRAVQELKPRTTTPGSFVCTIDELKANDRFIVTFEFHLWTTSLVEYYSNDLVVEIEANAEYKDSLDNNATTQVTRALGVVSIRVSPENTPAKSKSTPVWVIIVAILGGVLLLALAILALFKLGFFKRNRPPQDISSPQTDDTPPIVAS